MVKTRLNIPATLVHSVQGKQYKINGTLLSINESSDTCTMRFAKGHIEKDIPMSSILINEGFLDKVKEYGQKVASYIVKKVKGFIALVDETTKKVLDWSYWNVGNMALNAAKGNMPEGVYFAPSASLKNELKIKGMSIDQAFAEAERRDSEAITSYWTKVIKHAGTTDDSIQESVKFVNEHYYTPTNLYKSLNEAIYSYDDIKMGKNGFGMYGTALSSKQLKSRLFTNIKKQISGPLGGHADVVPMLIWGAPGIGKTAIIKSVLKEMANAPFGRINLNLEVIGLAGYTIENWTLPTIETNRKANALDTERFSDTPKVWLPVYLRTSDSEENKRRDAFCNASKFLTRDGSAALDGKGHEFEGGVVFFDEYSRVMPNVQNILMALANDHHFGDSYQVASKWGFVFASNRAIDENEADSDDMRYYPTGAQLNRFIHYTYVPSKVEWLEWAREVNPTTHKANVPPFITDFIEASDDYVWYSTIANGGYDDMLNNPAADKLAHQDDDDATSKVQEVLGQEMLLRTKRMVTPRTWANTIGPSYRQELETLFNENNEGLTGEEYYQKLVDQSIIEKTDEQGRSVKDYYGDILPDVLVDALNDIDDAYWDYWCETKGGIDELDPAGAYNGIRGRFNIFMSWFANEMREVIGDDTGKNAETATSPTMQAWKAYQSYSKFFTRDIIDTIWETGNVPEEFQKDDNKKPMQGTSGFRDYEYSKWKATTNTALEVLDLVFKGYPGSLGSDINQDIVTLQDKNTMSDSEVIAAAKELNNEYSFKINNKTVSLLFDDVEMKNIDTLRNKVFSLQNSRVAQLYAHFAAWVAKVALQTEVGDLAVKYKRILSNSCMNADGDSMTFLNVKNVQEAQAAETYAKAKGNKADVEKAHKNLLKAQSMIPIIPAINILQRVETYGWKETRKNK